MRRVFLCLLLAGFLAGPLLGTDAALAQSNTAGTQQETIQLVSGAVGILFVFLFGVLAWMFKASAAAQLAKEAEAANSDWSDMALQSVKARALAAPTQNADHETADTAETGQKPKFGKR